MEKDNYNPFVSPFDNEVFCPHFLWSDGEYDYDFGYEHKLPLIFAWTLHKGHIRRRALGLIRGIKILVKNGLKDIGVIINEVSAR